jgi:ATP-dependent exoDNAse (exonuclease V) alpha subunit
VHASQNLLVVSRASGDQLTYDPRRLHGVTVYREAERAFAAGDRVQLTAPDRARALANRELGTVEGLDNNGRVSVRLDSGRSVSFSLDRDRHLDYGYAVTSHSSQGLTAERVLVHVDTTQRGEALINQRFAHVAVSRGRGDVQIYTDDRRQLAGALSRETSHRSALDLNPKVQTSTQQIQPVSSPSTPTPSHARRQHEITR